LLGIKIIPRKNQKKQTKPLTLIFPLILLMYGCSQNNIVGNFVMTMLLSLFHRNVEPPLTSENKKKALIDHISRHLDEYRHKVSYANYKRAEADCVDGVVYEMMTNKLKIIYACLEYLERSGDLVF